MNQQILMQFAMNQIRNNEKVANSPMGKQFMSILQSGDQNAGEQMANNILQTYGKTKEDALRDVMNSAMFR